MRIPTKPLVLFGLALFVYIIWNTGPLKILNTLLSIDQRFLLVSLLFPIPGTLLKAYRWKRVVAYLKKKISLLEATKVWLVGLSASTITPGRAGDVIRGFYLADKTKLTLGKSISTVVIDRLFDVVSMTMLAIIGLFVLMFWFNVPFSISIVIFVVFMLFSSLMLVTNKRLVRIILGPLYKFVVPQKYKQKIKLSFDQFYLGLREMADKKRIAYLLAVSLFAWGLTFFQAYFIFLALHTDVPLLFLFAVLPIEILVSLIPVTVSGFGTREFTYLFFFSLIGIAPEVVVAFSLLSVLIVWITAAIGFGFWLKEPIDIRL